LGGLEITIPPLGAMGSIVSLSFIDLPIELKMLETFKFYLALHSMKSILYFLAKACPSAKLTCLSSLRQSDLFPTITLQID
jgi:hypothetical protein